jgi:hypothetical protein
LPLSDTMQLSSTSSDSRTSCCSCKLLDSCNVPS